MNIQKERKSRNPSGSFQTVWKLDYTYRESTDCLGKKPVIGAWDSLTKETRYYHSNNKCSVNYLSIVIFCVLSSNIKSKSSSQYWQLKEDINDYQMQKKTMGWLPLFSYEEYLGWILTENIHSFSFYFMLSISYGSSGYLYEDNFFSWKNHLKLLELFLTPLILRIADCYYLRIE